MLQIELGLPEVDLKSFLTKAKATALIESLDASLCLLDIFVANVTNLVVSVLLTGFSILYKVFKFQRYDLSSFSHLISELILSSFLWDESNEYVSFKLLLHVLGDW